MPTFLDPAESTPDERFRELARLLAVGLLRLASPLVSIESPTHPATKIPSKFDTNELAVQRTKSVTVQAS